jgi:peptidoglycan/LPS O-acetylase OafA/YrhL
MAPLFLTSLLFIVKDSVDIGTRITEKTYYVSYIYFFTMVITIAMYAMASSYGLIAIVTIQFIGNLLLVALTLFNSEKLFRIGFGYFVNIGLVIIIYVFTWLISSYELAYMDMFLVLLIVTLCFIVLMRPLIKDVSVGRLVSNKK